MKSFPGVRSLLPGLLLALLLSPAGGGELQEKLITAAFTGDLPEMRKRRLVRALVVYGPTDFFFYQGKPQGIQVDLLKEYEKFLNTGKRRETDRIVIVFVPVPFEELIPALLEGKGDIAAHFLTPTEARRRQGVAFASGEELSVDEVLVSHAGAPGIAELEDLAGKKVYVLRGSSYMEHLEALNEKFLDRGLEPIRIEAADARLRSEDILELVNAGVVSYTVVDDYKAALWSKVLPEIRVHEALAVSRANSIGWAVRKENRELLTSLRKFTGKVKQGTLIGNMLIKRYYRTTKWIDSVLETVRAAPWHTYQFLTKAPGGLIWHDFPAHAWVGVTVTRQAHLEPALRALDAVSAPSVKFLSFEPFLERINLPYLLPINWAIVGGLTGAPWDVEAMAPEVSRLVEALDAAGVPVFQKPNLGAARAKWAVSSGIEEAWPDA